MNAPVRAWFQDTLRGITALLNADEHAASLMAVVAFFMFLVTGFILNISWGYEILRQEGLSQPIVVDTTIAVDESMDPTDVSRSPVKAK